MTAEEDRPEVTAPESARREIEALVQRFARNLDVYTRPDYKETQVRVERVPDLDKKVAGATSRADKKLYHRQIEATDAEIDTLVYELYGLSDDEIAIIEVQCSRPAHRLHHWRRPPGRAETRNRLGLGAL